MLPDLKETVREANRDLAKHGLAPLTFGNVSGIDRRRGVVAIKPSGVSYENLRSQDIVLVDLEGRVVEGKLNPSSDTLTHLELYKSFHEVGGIAHAHSIYATMFAQARKAIPCFGTTHADAFNGSVPVTRHLTRKEVRENYEGNTGKLIVDRFSSLDPSEIPAVLVAGHGPFSWGDTAQDAVRNLCILEHVAKTALGTLYLNPQQIPLASHILQKHFARKHGPRATYGQKKGDTS